MRTHDYIDPGGIHTLEDAPDLSQHLLQKLECVLREIRVFSPESVDVRPTPTSKSGVFRLELVPRTQAAAQAINRAMGEDFDETA